ncbi:hypothetical protein [uncultured Chryseobacterium sp.]|uniref:hypothetical protein n=1 Tax=uncultured Chryseobacterium sp. TaxID=259322 RepID=UPI0025D54B62|nr:hypothetical protein [uncultured Chryseobacterium sp.]
MRKNILLKLLLFLASNLLWSQASTEDKKSYIDDINKIFPPAPTANNLMKFEEVPVSYYTGIPEISIPLFNIPTGNARLNINLQLKYHPLNAKPEDRSGETGLGWSLLAGGTISRTVRGGNPDEKNRTVAFSSPPKVKYGIYNDTYNPTSKIINNENIDINEYAFYAAMGKYDTEYDLYQYNFMGNVGRFIVKKDTNGNYFAEKLDKNNLQIICNKDANSGIIMSFTIVDDKGLKYFFDAMEKSQKTISTIKTGLTTGIGNINPSTEIGDFYTSFHLLKVNDQSDINLLIFKYNQASVVKFNETPTTTNRLPKNINYTNSTADRKSPDGNMPGMYERQYTYTTSQTKLLTSIELRGKGTIYLNYEIGREDSNYSEAENLYKLKSIQSNITDQNINQYIEKYTFDYGYSNTNFQSNTGEQQVLKKMLLKKVTKVSSTNQNLEYNLDYNTSDNLLTKDNWGYYKGAAIYVDVLKSITHLTKGRTIFNFGENDYSYCPIANSSPMEQVVGKNVTENIISDVTFSEFSANEKKEFFAIENPQSVHIHTDFGNLTNYNWKFIIYKKTSDNQYIKVQEIVDISKYQIAPHVL